MKKIFLFTILGIILTSAAVPAYKLVQQSPAQYSKNENQNSRLTAYDRYNTSSSQAPDSVCKKKIGDYYKGGVLCGFATMDSDIDITEECHGFVCAPTDQPAASWADAMAECKALRIGGYSNWRLPTKAEIMLMHRLYRQGLAGISWWSYWSSSDNFYNASMNNMAWYYYFGTDHADFETKDAIHPVRAVRSF